MKLAYIISTLFIGASLLFAIEACEQECRDGVAGAFSDKYKLELEPLFDEFKTNLASSILTGVDTTKLGSTTVGTDVTNAVTTTADSLKASFVGSLHTFVLDAVFTQQPKFMGDCNHPKRVVQPPRGVPWQRSDCAAMDYVCGNPPSICHFIDTVKARNVGTINFELAYNATSGGPFFKTIHQAVYDASLASGVSITNSNTYLIPVTDVNIEKALVVLVQNVQSKFCAAGSCDKYDNDITTLLLSFP